MKWKRGKRSGDLEDRRASSGGGGFPGMGGGGGFPIPMGKGGGGIGTILILLVVYFVFIKGCGGGDGTTGFDVPAPPSAQAPAQGTGSGSIPEASDPEDKLVDFVDFVFADVNDFWQQQLGGQYQRAKVVVFRDGVSTGCGQASSATGPFYCPPDQMAYVDLSFFEELNRRFKAPGDFAQAYVLAHEVGHHIQHQLGIEQEVREKSQANPDDENELSVRLELQADCFAGVWAHSVYERGMLESGDLEEGLNAASAVGDDRIQEQAGGRADPESFTHGTAEQRSKWLNTGFESGEQGSCDTFAVDEP